MESDPKTAEDNLAAFIEPGMVDAANSSLISRARGAK